MLVLARFYHLGPACVPACSFACLSVVLLMFVAMAGLWALVIVLLFGPAGASVVLPLWWMTWMVLCFGCVRGICGGVVFMYVLCVGLQIVFLMCVGSGSGFQEGGQLSAFAAAQPVSVLLLPLRYQAGPLCLSCCYLSDIRQGLGGTSCACAFAVKHGFAVSPECTDLFLCMRNTLCAACRAWAPHRRVSVGMWLGYQTRGHALLVAPFSSMRVCAGRGGWAAKGIWMAGLHGCTVLAEPTLLRRRLWTEGLRLGSMRLGAVAPGLTAMYAQAGKHVSDAAALGGDCKGGSLTCSSQCRNCCHQCVADTLHKQLCLSSAVRICYGPTVTALRWLLQQQFSRATSEKRVAVAGLCMS
jgi:hypothetical protein